MILELLLLLFQLITKKVISSTDIISALSELDIKKVYGSDSFTLVLKTNLRSFTILTRLTVLSLPINFSLSFLPETCAVSTCSEKGVLLTSLTSTLSNFSILSLTESFGNLYHLILPQTTTMTFVRSMLYW